MGYIIWVIWYDQYVTLNMYWMFMSRYTGSNLMSMSWNVWKKTCNGCQPVCGIDNKITSLPAWISFLGIFQSCWNTPYLEYFSVFLEFDFPSSLWFDLWFFGLIWIPFNSSNINQPADVAILEQERKHAMHEHQNQMHKINRAT